MLNIPRFLIFLFILIVLPIIVNIVDNIVKILTSFNKRVYINGKILEFNERELRDFIVEFLERSYNYKFRYDNEDIYIIDKDKEMMLYYNNIDSSTLDLYELRNILAIGESRGTYNIFIFTTKVLSNDALEFINSKDMGYNIKYIHGNDLKLYYDELIVKFY